MIELVLGGQAEADVEGLRVAFGAGEAQLDVPFPRIPIRRLPDLPAGLLKNQRFVLSELSCGGLIGRGSRLDGGQFLCDGRETLEQILPKIDMAPEAIDTLEPVIPTPSLNPTDSSLPSLPLEATRTSGPANTPTPLPILPGTVPTEPPQMIPTLPPATAPNILPTLDLPPATAPDSLPTVQAPSLIP